MKTFGERLSEVTEDTLMRVFGEPAAQLIKNFVERHASKPKENGNAFHPQLATLLGSEVAGIIRNASLKRLHHTLQQEYEEVENYFSLLDKLYDLKFKLLVSRADKEGSVHN